MKIGILTLPLHTNYGGILQAYALQTVLQRMGHEVQIVEKNKILSEDFYHEVVSLLYYFKLGCKGKYRSNHSINRDKYIREQNTKLFIDRHISVLKVKSIVNDFPNSVDAIIVGSDQVWRKRTFCGMCGCGIENAFLKFAEGWNVKRIAYAASFGTDSWEYTEEETKDCSCLLSKFDSIGVREISGVDLCSNYLGNNNAVHVLDPTMLLQKEDYEKLICDTVKRQSGSLMVYFLDETQDKIDLVNRIAQERHLNPFSTNKSDDEIKRDRQAVQPPLEDWIRGFRDADFVVTDSFHACVFSILFNKPFIAYGNNKRGMSRFLSLLSMFGLTDHLLLSINSYQSNHTYEIPKETNTIISLKRKESLDFLNKSLL